MPGPTARHARHCPSDEGLASSLRYLSPRVGNIDAKQTQEAGDAYAKARDALIDRLLADEERGPALEKDPRFARALALVRTDEERALAETARFHRERAIFGLLGLAAAFARAHRGAGQGGGRGLQLVAPGGEALQGALEHVHHAVDGYDPARGVKLSTFAAWHAFRGVQLERLRAGPVRLNATALTRWGELQDMEARLSHELGREPTFDEVATAFGSPSKVRTAVAAARALRPILSTSVSRVDDDRPLHDIPDDGPDPEEFEDRRRVRNHCAAVVEAVAPPGSQERAVAEALADGGAKAAGAAVGKAVASRVRSVMRRRASDLR